jgi:polyphosphate kinase
MERNLDHRIEITCPVYDKELQKDLMNMLQIQLSDNCKARIISADNPNRYKLNSNGKKIRAQVEIYNYYKRIVEQES